jgi:hypothetical protein
MRKAKATSNNQREKEISFKRTCGVMQGEQKQKPFGKLKNLTRKMVLRIFDKQKYQLLLGVLAAVALGHTGEPVDADSQEDVDDDVDPHNAKVTPGILVVTGH